MRSLPSTFLSIAHLVLIAAVLSGCYSISNAQPPETLAPGRFRVGVGGFVGAAPGEAKYAPEVGLRVGVLPRVDVGVKTTGFAAQGDVKVLVVDGPIKLAAAPAVIFADDGDLDPLFDENDSENEEKGWPIVALRTPLLGGVELGHGAMLLFGPDAHFGWWNGDVLARDSVRYVQTGAPAIAGQPVLPATARIPGTSDRFIGLGGHAGVLLRGVGDAGMIAEVGVLRIVHGVAGGSMDASAAPWREYADGATRVQLTLTFLLGEAFQ